MAWDKTQPTNSTKIRNAPGVIQANWKAIEDGDATLKPQALNLDNRTPLGVTNNPAQIANTMVLFCKEDTPGQTQLYAIDGNIALADAVQQLTRFDDFTAGNTGYSYLLGDIRVQWGRHTTTNTTTQTVVFSPVFTAAPYIVIPMLLRPSTARVFCNTRSLAAGQFVANTVDQSNAAIAAGGTMFWIAIGK